MPNFVYYMMFEVNADGKVANKLMKIQDDFQLFAPEYFDKAHVHVGSDVCLNVCRKAYFF